MERLRQRKWPNERYRSIYGDASDFLTSFFVNCSVTGVLEPSLKLGRVKSARGPAHARTQVSASVSNLINIFWPSAASRAYQLAFRPSSTTFQPLRLKTDGFSKN